MGKHGTNIGRANLPGGIAHVTLLLAKLAAAFLVFRKYPKLVDSDLATFGSVGTFVSVYAALFAVFEAVRAKSTAREAALAAKNVAEQFRRLSRTELITACAHYIETALETFYDGNGLPITLLSKIVALYAQVFSKDVVDAKSDHAANNALIVAYIGLAKPTKNPAKTLAALTLMKSQLLILKETTVFPETP